VPRVIISLTHNYYNNMYTYLHYTIFYVVHNNSDNNNIIAAVYLHVVGTSQFAGIPCGYVCVLWVYTVKRVRTRRLSDFDYNKITRFR